MQKRDYVKAYIKEIPNFFSIFMYPIFLMSTSPILLDMSTELNIDIANLSFIFTFLITGNILGQVTSVFYNARFKKLNIILFSYALLIPLMCAMMFFRQLYSFYIIYFISGYILGVIWIQANEFLLESRIENKNRLINIALVFFPVGAAVAPLLSIFVSGLGINWKYIFIIIAGFIIVTLVLYLSFKRGKPSKKIEVEEKIILKQIFFSKNNNFIFILVAAMLFFYGLTETIIFTFAPTFFRIEKLINPQIAGLSLSVFWIAISIGRIIISTLLCRLKVNLVALGLTLFSLAALLLIIYLNGTFAMLAAIFLTGLGYSGIFSLLFLNGSSIYEKGRAVLETILFVITSLGAALAPYLVKLATSIDLKIAIFLSLIFISLISIMLIIHIFYSKKYLDNKKTC